MAHRRYRSLGILFVATTLQGCNCAHTRQSVYPDSTAAPVEMQAVAPVPMLDIQAPRKVMPGSTSIDVPMLTH